MSDYLDPLNEELLQDFFQEALLQLETLETSILALESNPAQLSVLDEIFRAAHTLKGGAATVQMAELAGFTHHLEDLLDALRQERYSVDQNMVTLLLRSLDLLQNMLESRMQGRVFTSELLEQTNQELQDLLHKPSDHQEKSSTPQASKTDNKKELQKISSQNQGFIPLLSLHELRDMRSMAGRKSFWRIDVAFDTQDPLVSLGPLQVMAILKDSGLVLETSPPYAQLVEDEVSSQVAFYTLFEELDSEKLEGKIKKTGLVENVEWLEIPQLDQLESFVAQHENPPAPSKGTELPQDLAAAVKHINAQNSKNAENTQPLKNKENEENEHKIANQENKSTPKSNAPAPLLRVESRRVDALLNLISEAVINKASFNQLYQRFSEYSQLLGESYLQQEKQWVNFFDYVLDLVAEHPTWDRPALKQAFFKRLDEEEIHSLKDVLLGRQKLIENFKMSAQNLNRIINDLHEAVLQIRMIPISQLFSRFPRLVRDLSQRLGKDIRLLLVGEDTELDKTVADELLDPLMHCVRNSLDHGLETPQERLEKGKTAQGTVRLIAQHMGNTIEITIEDDGRGIDRERILQRAVERGLVDKQEANLLSDKDVYQLLFKAGFSTAAVVTDISGRGVGLDVVKQNIERLNGSIQISSRIHQGSSFVIRLPLTLAIVQGLLVQVGKEVYALPLSAILETHRLKRSAVSLVDGYESYTLRGEVLSIVHISDLFDLPKGSQGDSYLLLILGNEERRVALCIDAILGEEDLVIKPLRDRYTKSPGIAGATILGDGRVALIIDVSALIDFSLSEKMVKGFRQGESLWT